MEKGHEITVLDRGFVRLVDFYGTDQRIVESARLSYKSPSKGEEADKKLLFYLYKNSHSSPFEQCSITFDIKLPLFVQGQLVRHRTQRLNQVSARYTEMPDEFYIPEFWRGQDNKNKQGSVETHLNHIYCKQITEVVCKQAYDQYISLINHGVAREMARMLLPQNLYTEIYTEWDLNNLMKFFRLRLDEHAQFEIRAYASAMYEIFETLFPVCSAAYKRFKWELVDKKPFWESNG